MLQEGCQGPEIAQTWRKNETVKWVKKILQTSTAIALVSTYPRDIKTYVHKNPVHDCSEQFNHNSQVLGKLAGLPQANGLKMPGPSCTGRVLSSEKERAIDPHKLVGPLATVFSEVTWSQRFCVNNTCKWQDCRDGDNEWLPPHRERGWGGARYNYTEVATGFL